MKSMWEEHNGEDEREIYGEMLMETFSIAVSELKLYHACLFRIFAKQFIFPALLSYLCYPFTLMILSMYL